MSIIFLLKLSLSSLNIFRVSILNSLVGCVSPYLVLFWGGRFFLIFYLGHYFFCFVLFSHSGFLSIFVFMYWVLFFSLNLYFVD